MLTIDNDAKLAYNQYTTQRKSYIISNGNVYYIQNLDLYADAYDEGNIVGNAIAKTLTFDIETEYVRGLNEFEVFDGIYVDDDYKYISLGTFKLFEEQGTDDFFSTITAYDKLVLFNKPYSPNLTTYPISIYNLLNNICQQAGVALNTLSIPNGLKIIEGNLFSENETLKDVLKAICQISGTFALISNDELQLKLMGNDTFTLSNYQLSNPEYKRTTWKINQVILGMQDIEGEYVLMQDDDDIARNGVHKIVINNNPFAYTQELRQAYITELYNQLKGFGYVAYESEWEGLPYVELGDLVTIGDYESIVLRYELKSPDGLNSLIQAPSIIDSVIDYVDNTNDLNNRLMKTEYKVDKAEGNISQLTQKTEQINDSLSNNYYTVEQTNLLIQNAETGLTNTFSEAGGNNVLKNTRFFAQEVLEQGQVYEYWYGNVERTTNDNAANGFSILLQDNLLYQTQQVANGNYTLSFNYNILNPLATCKVIINGTEYVLDEDYTMFQTGIGEIEPIQINANQITIGFESDIADACEVYDIMLNAGQVKLAYSQNQNETVTNTVNISKGITIEANDTNVKFSATPDGIRIKNKNTNATVTYFTDRGTETNNLIAKDSADIVGIYRQKVGNQIWDSFI